MNIPGVERRLALLKLSDAYSLLFHPSMATQPWTEPGVALELGAALLMDKPIIVLVLPGRVLPARVRQVADEVVECDISGDPALATRLIRDAVQRIKHRQAEAAG